MGDTSITANRRARVEVAPELIAKALHFPDGTEILFAEWKFDQGGTVVLVVEHEDLEPAAEGTIVPTVVPTVKYHRESWDFDWNQG